MGFLRKTVKKIGRGIKKVVKKIGKAFGKLGIVGRIGLMFLMPHLGTMWGNIGSWAAKGSNILQKAVGVIHKAGTAVGNAYQTVTQAISNGFDRSLNFMKGEGFVLSDPSKTIFKTPEQKFVEEKGLSIDLEAAEKAGIKLDIEGAEKFQEAMAKTNVTEEVTQPSILAKIKDKAEEAVTKGAIQGLTTRTKYAVAGEPPTSRQLVTYADTGGLPTTGSGMGIFNTTDLTQQSFQMNNWQDISQYYAVPVNQRLG